MNTGNLPPEKFIYLDAKGYIQDQNGIPKIYLMRREYPKKRIGYAPCRGLYEYRPSDNILLSNIDEPNVESRLIKYWWLRDGDGFG